MRTVETNLCQPGSQAESRERLAAVSAGPRFITGVRTTRYRRDIGAAEPPPPVSRLPGSCRRVEPESSGLPGSRAARTPPPPPPPPRTPLGLARQALNRPRQGAASRKAAGKLGSRGQVCVCECVGLLGGGGGGLLAGLLEEEGRPTWVQPT